jgi:KDO2-lipid IV(A) lauroyltransferase
MKRTRGLETLLVRATFAALRASGWRRSLAIGAGIGDLARALGLRRRVAEANLALAFPELDPPARADILTRHYRVIGQAFAEYARLGELARAGSGEVVAGVSGLEHLERARAGGKGAILLSGHYGNVELLGAWLGRMNPVDFVVQALSNPEVESLLAAQRAAAGVGQIASGASLRRIYEALRENRWVAILADQDARRGGVFVPFFGRPSSTAIGPARIALGTGAPIIMGFATRLADGRHHLEVEPPLEIEDPGAPDAALRLTALHASRLEHHVRKHPDHWFWLHRRWKTAPAPAAAVAVAAC